LNSMNTIVRKKDDEPPQKTNEPKKYSPYE